MADDADSLNGTGIQPDVDIKHEVEEQFRTIGTNLYNTVGSRKFNVFEESLRGFDNLRNTLYMTETEGHGYTFITRPKLNLSTPSIRTDRILAMLDTLDPQTLGFTVRALLDTSLISRYNLSTSDSLYFNRLNPFITILSNRLMSLNGWPDPTLDVETTEGGFFSESITYPKGHDQLSRNYDIAATFSDIQGSIIHTLFTMWLRWIHLANRGRVTAYMEDIEARRMCFTCSIYRFVMDPSKRYITKWAKATGCYPRSLPSGAYFNYDANASNVDTSMNLSIPFTVGGKIEYMDPIILREFNMLMDKYGPSTKNNSKATGNLKMLLNFKCLPYIDVVSGSNELMWLYDTDDSDVYNLMNEAGYME